MASHIVYGGLQTGFNPASPFGQGLPPSNLVLVRDPKSPGPPKKKKKKKKKKKNLIPISFLPNAKLSLRSLVWSTWNESGES